MLIKCPAPSRVACSILLDDGSRHEFLTHLVMRSSLVASAVRSKAAPALPVLHLEGVSAHALQTALAFLQRVHNVADRPKSVRIAWKSVCPQLLEPPKACSLLSLVRAARALDAQPLRRLACEEVANRIRTGQLLSGVCADGDGAEECRAAASDALDALGGIDALAECLECGLDTAAAAGEAPSHAEDLLRIAAKSSGGAWEQAVDKVRLRRHMQHSLGLDVDLLKCSNQYASEDASPSDSEAVGGRL